MSTSNGNSSDLDDVVRPFVEQYDDDDFQTTLVRLEQAISASRGSSVEDWARGVYIALRLNPQAEPQFSWNMDRKKIVNLLMGKKDAKRQTTDGLLTIWDKQYQFSDDFCAAIKRIFQVKRLVRILQISLPMDRAQAWYKMKHGDTIGLPWVSKYHEEYLDEHPDDCPWKQDYEALYEDDAVREMLEDKTVTRPLSGKLGHLLYHPTLQLQSNKKIKQWSLPANRPPGLEEAIVAIYKGKFEEKDTKDALNRLLDCKGDQEAEEWAKQFFFLVRTPEVDVKSPEDKEKQSFYRKLYEEDHKIVMNLVYEVVDQWEEFGYSIEFEKAIQKVFKPCLVQILNVCLPLERAEVLHRKQLTGATSYGIPWYSERHLIKETTLYAKDNAEEQEKLQSSVDFNSMLSPSMDERLFCLLYSPELGMQANEYFRDWSKPKGFDLSAGILELYCEKQVGNIQIKSLGPGTIGSMVDVHSDRSFLEFYSFMLKRLNSHFTATSCIASGRVDASGSMKNQFLDLLRVKTPREALKEGAKIALSLSVAAGAISTLSENIPLPGAGMVGNVLSSLVRMMDTDELDTGKAAVRASYFEALAEHRDGGLRAVVDKTCKSILWACKREENGGVAASGLPRLSKWQQRMYGKIAAAGISTTNQEQGWIAADHTMACILNPPEGSLLHDILDGDKEIPSTRSDGSPFELREILVEAALDLDMTSARELTKPPASVKEIMGEKKDAPATPAATTADTGCSCVLL